MRQYVSSFVHLVFALVSLAFASGLSVRADGVFRSVFVPVGPSAFCMRQPYGERSFFLRDPECPQRLLGNGTWICELDGPKALACKVSENGVSESGYLFLDGRLRRTLLNGCERALRGDEGAYEVHAPCDLWANRNELLKPGQPPDIWQNSGRLRLWYKNPNMAGLMLAEILIVIFSLFFTSCAHRALMVIPLGAAFMLIVSALFQTGSRGSFIAVVIGILVMLITWFRQLMCRRMIILGACLVGVIAAAILMSPFRARMTSEFFSQIGDKSNAIRIETCSAAPRMFVAAPFGWGFGQSGKAFVDWYQNRDEFVCDNLISNHLTLMVEGGWIFSVVYWFVWLLLIFLSFGSAWRKDSPLLIGLVSVLFVGGILHPCMKEWTLFVLPLLSLFFSIREFRTFQRRKLLAIAGICLILALVGTVVFSVVGYNESNSLHIVCHKDSVVIGSQDTTVCIVDDGYTMNGGFWWKQGKFVRRWFQRHPDVSCRFVRKLQDVPQSTHRIVLIGLQGECFIQAWREHCLDLPNLNEVVFLSPSFRLDEVPSDFLEQYAVSGFRGEFLSEVDNSVSRPWMKQVRGMELYLPKWLDYALKK